jgi:hypothetical protein|tara:strand:+ start:765 stop:1100 length:336 start_codon:yes stop_codon:yes gene_type:complete
MTKQYKVKKSSDEFLEARAKREGLSVDEYKAKREAKRIELAKEKQKLLEKRDLMMKYWNIAYLDLPDHMTDDHAIIFNLGMDMARAILQGDEKRVNDIRKEMTEGPLYLNL